MNITPKQIEIYNGKICPYCNSETKVVSEEFIYGKSYQNKYMICCKNFPKCNSYVGTHKEDGSSLGRLANKSLRQYKKIAHDHFDWIWKNKYFDRNELYQALSEELKIPREYCHIGWFNIKTCKKVIDWSIERRREIEE